MTAMSNLNRQILRILLSAVGGLVVILAAQFHTQDFAPHDYMVSEGSTEQEVAIGGYFLVKFPDDWTNAERYDFDWQKLKGDDDPFRSLTF